MIEEDKEDVLTSEATREQLIAIWELFLAECIRYLRDTPPEKFRLNRLEVIRAFLRDNEMVIDGGHIEDVQKSLARLSAMDLPFK
jgi:hypothetical protein